MQLCCLILRSYFIHGLLVLRCRSAASLSPGVCPQSAVVTLSAGDRAVRENISNANGPKAGSMSKFMVPPTWPPKRCFIYGLLGNRFPFHSLRGPVAIEGNCDRRCSSAGILLNSRLSTKLVNTRQILQQYMWICGLEMLVTCKSCCNGDTQCSNLPTAGDIMY